MDITRQSPISGITRTVTLDVTDDEVLKYMSGVSIQDAFPNLSPDEREFILTGIAPEEWDAMFAGTPE